MSRGSAADPRIWTQSSPNYLENPSHCRRRLQLDSGAKISSWRLRDRDYRIVTRLGSGGVGTTFKVVEIDRVTKEDLGTYVAKTAHQQQTGQRILKSYSLARSHLGLSEALSTILPKSPGSGRKTGLSP